MKPVRTALGLSLVIVVCLNLGKADNPPPKTDKMAPDVMIVGPIAAAQGDRLAAKGYGQSKPLVPNVTAGNRARNRRVQFIILDQEPEAPAAPKPKK